MTGDVARRPLDDVLGWRPTVDAPDGEMSGADRAGGLLPLGLDQVPARPLVVEAPVLSLSLGLGDRILVSAGESVSAGAILADRLREVEQGDGPAVDGPAADGVRPTVAADGPASDDEPFAPGAWWTADATPANRHANNGRAMPGPAAGELLYPYAGRWRRAGGAHWDALEAPTAGIVRDARAGIGLTFAAVGLAIPGIAVVGGPARGRLQLATAAHGELRPAGLDVGRTGTILIAGSRSDAETLIRARAMGVRGVVVATLSGKDLRDFVASERRQRASLHQLPPFAVLVLDGHLRRPIAGPVMAIFAALEGREVAIAGDPPMLIVEGDLTSSLPLPPADWVRARHGVLAGREGRWAGPAGLRRFAAGTHLEAGLVRFDEGAPVALPLADLERFG